MIALELVEPRKPIIAMMNARKTRYHLNDPFLRFYYRFVDANASAIAHGRLGQVKQALVAQLRSFVGLYVFQVICRDWGELQADLGRLGIRPDLGQIESYWSSTKGTDVQIDVAATAMSSKQALMGECEWGDEVVSKSVPTDFFERCKKVTLPDPDWRVQHLMFARVGFAPATVQEAAQLSVRLVDLAEVEDDLAAEL